jgi:hypothetical protein
MTDRNSNFAGTASVDVQLRRWFRGHVMAVALTGTLVFVLLVGFGKVPPTLSVCFCAVVACSAVAFACKSIIENRRRWDYMAVSFGLSITQLVFILPVIACVFAPEANFRTMLFG